MNNIIYQINNFKFNYPLSSRAIEIIGKFSIFQGDRILLSGASGCGKSTLLLALKGLIPNYIRGEFSGDILFNGQIISELSAIQLQSIGYLQQNPDHQLIYQTVIDELAFGLENQHLPQEEIAEKINAIAKKFNIAHLLNRKIATLSGGEKQKINLIAILLSSPTVLLLDEPTAFLDPESATNIIEILNTLDTNTTIIIIDHNQHYYKNYVNRILAINSGQQIEKVNLANFNWYDKYPNFDKTSYSSEIILSINNLNSTELNSNSNNLFTDLNLTLHKGEIAVIKGKNGVGKSTLMRMIAKLTKSTGISFNSIAINNISNNDYWQQVGLLWQNPEHHFLHGSVAEELVNDTTLLTKYNLLEQSKNNPYCLSEGQKRRLSLAIALTTSRKLFLLDEPTFGQDLNNKIELIKSIKELSLSGHSFLIISHDDEFSNTIAQTQYTLTDGKLWQS